MSLPDNVVYRAGDRWIMRARAEISGRCLSPLEVILSPPGGSPGRRLDTVVPSIIDEDRGHLVGG